VGSFLCFFPLFGGDMGRNEAFLPKFQENRKNLKEFLPAATATILAGAK
jgi:hypothetical protein